MAKRLGVIAEVDVASQVVAVTGAPGSAGIAAPINSATSQVSVTNISVSCNIQCNVNGGAWTELAPSEGVHLEINMASAVLYLRRATIGGGLASVQLGAEGLPVLKTLAGAIISGGGTPATAPGAPTSVTATAGDRTASVSWVAPANNGGSAITGYVATDSSTGTQYTATTSPLNLTGLFNGTARTFSVVAVNAVGPSAAAVSNSVTPAVPNVFSGPGTNEVGTGQYYTNRVAMRNSKRVALTVQNTNATSSIDVTTGTRQNNDYTWPGTGNDPSPNIVAYAQTIPPGQQTVITADPGQVYVRATAVASASLSASGMTVTATFAGGHKLTAAQIAAGQKIDFFFAAPAAYNGSGITPTYVDANTLTWTAATAPGGAGTTQGYLAQAGLVCTVFEESTP